MAGCRSSTPTAEHQLHARLLRRVRRVCTRQHLLRRAGAIGHQQQQWRRRRQQHAPAGGHGVRGLLPQPGLRLECVLDAREQVGVLLHT